MPVQALILLVHRTGSHLLNHSGSERMEKMVPRGDEGDECIQ